MLMVGVRSAHRRAGSARPGGDRESMSTGAPLPGTLVLPPEPD
jgi:hypothetical protein